MWLVVEISDDSRLQDLTVKAKVYGSTGFAAYWVITEDVVFAHTEPNGHGHRTRTEYRTGDRIPLPYADATLSAADLIG